jgi:antitoxin (DNA-binding transcriptional repressor) of toxin-antitoxin stability system
MKILTTYEAKNAFPEVLKLSQKDVVIVTNSGKPVAAIEGLNAKTTWRIIFSSEARNTGPWFFISTLDFRLPPCQLNVSNSSSDHSPIRITDSWPIFIKHRCESVVIDALSGDESCDLRDMREKLLVRKLLPW